MMRVVRRNVWAYFVTRDINPLIFDEYAYTFEGDVHHLVINRRTVAVLVLRL